MPPRRLSITIAFFATLYCVEEMEHCRLRSTVDWIYSIAKVVEQKIRLCTEAPSPLHMERRMRGEVLTTQDFLNILYWFEERNNTTDCETNFNKGVCEP
jgi:hypothetical protein